MDPELMHQLYGGEIQDYIPTKGSPLAENKVVHSIDDDLQSVYETQVRGKPHIDTTGIFSANTSQSFERDPHFQKIETQLAQTLSQISQQLELVSADTPARRPDTATIQPQTQGDIDAANNNVLQALEELKSLNAGFNDTNVKCVTND